MSHYICKGSCGGTLNEVGICEADRCTNQWEMMEECNCSDGRHGKSLEVKDSNGATLNDGDKVALIKDLTLRGSSTVIKRGTKTTIRLTDNPEEVDAKVDGMSIVLRVEFLKKL